MSKPLALCFLFFPSLALAQVPNRLAYQGRLVKADGSPERGAQTFVFTLHKTPTGASPVWTETQTLALSDGYYAAMLGDATPSGCSGNCAGIPLSVFDGAELYLDIAVDDSSLAPRQRVDSVAYAMMATNARNVVGGTVEASSLTVGGTTGVSLTPTGISIGALTLSSAGLSVGSDTIIDSRGRFAGNAVAAIASARPTSPDPGAILFNPHSSTLELFDGTGWQVFERRLPTSCKDVLAQGLSTGDGPYLIRPVWNGSPVTVYCDMTTSGGGWTLASYGYRATTGGTSTYSLPNSFTASWNPIARNGVAAIDASQMLKSATQVALSVSTGTFVTGNLLSYAGAWAWTLPNPSIAVFDLQDPVAYVGNTSPCTTVTVTELHSSSTFSAKTFYNKPQVSCSGNKGATSYERQFLGFNSADCYGVCGSDPATSMGMVVWYGSGYVPTTSGGAGNPERSGSFAFWVK